MFSPSSRFCLQSGNCFSEAREGGGIAFQIGLNYPQYVVHIIAYEAVQFLYLPNPWQLKRNGNSIGLMRDQSSMDAWYAEGPNEQANILGCPRMYVPGHRQG